MKQEHEGMKPDRQMGLFGYYLEAKPCRMCGEVCNIADSHFSPPNWNCNPDDPQMKQALDGLKYSSVICRRCLGQIRRAPSPDCAMCDSGMDLDLEAMEDDRLLFNGADSYDPICYQCAYVLDERAEAHNAEQYRAVKDGILLQPKELYDGWTYWKHFRATMLGCAADAEERVRDQVRVYPKKAKKKPKKGEEWRFQPLLDATNLQDFMGHERTPFELACYWAAKRQLTRELRKLGVAVRG